MMSSVSHSGMKPRASPSSVSGAPACPPLPPPPYSWRAYISSSARATGTAASVLVSAAMS
eukprot:scaffold94778_cov36-Phaeocystis_antarctica.AAC.1